MLGSRFARRFGDPGLRQLVVLAGLAIALTGCGGEEKLSARETQEYLEKSQGYLADLTCKPGSNGWDYVCTYTDPSRRLTYGTDRVQTAVEVDASKIRVSSDVMRRGEPLPPGPGSPETKVRAAWREQADGVCDSARSETLALAERWKARPVTFPNLLAALDEQAPILEEAHTMLTLLEPASYDLKPARQMRALLKENADDLRETVVTLRSLHERTGKWDVATLETWQRESANQRAELERRAENLGLDRCARWFAP